MAGLICSGMSEQAAEAQVLIVDDDPVMGELLDALLTVEGYRVTRAQLRRRGAAGRSRRHAETRHHPLRHPDARHAWRRTREDTWRPSRADGTVPASSVILAMSGSSPRADELQSFDGLLRKPFSVADFTRAVRQARTQTARRIPVETEQPSTDKTPARLPPLDDNDLRATEIQGRQRPSAADVRDDAGRRAQPPAAHRRRR